jgi:tetratricopeptide (TPR) repeat protein
MQDAKQIMEQGWKARELLDFVTAENLLNQAKEIFKQNEDWFNYTECLNHLAYTKKLKAAAELDEGLILVEEAKQVASEKLTKDTLVLRAEISLLEAKGNFEKAKIIAQKLLETAQKPEVKADALSHLSTFNLRTGNIVEAEELINEAVTQMAMSTVIADDQVINIWRCRLALAQSIIAFNKNDISKALQFANQAKEIAEANALKPRLKQVETILNLIQSKN